MRTQIEKNMEKLLEDIEVLSGQEMTDKVAQYLSAYRGAYKALCMVKGEEEYPVEAKTAQSETTARTLELDGDTEFERVIMEIPADYAHMVAITSIFADHMEGLKITNNRAYNNVMARLREVAR
jgi:hypothetical protein